MKKIIFISVLILFQSYLLSLAVEKDSMEVIEHDSLTVLIEQRELINKNQNDDKWFYWTGVVGLGSTVGSAYNYHWTDRWYNGPVLSLGIELSFTKSRSFCLELFNYTGFLEEKNRRKCVECYVYSDEIKINDSYYIKNLLIVVGLKFNILSLMENDKLKITGNFGVPINSFDGFNLGLGLSYQYSKDITYCLQYRTMFELQPLAGGNPEDYIPNLLSLNYCYNF